MNFEKRKSLRPPYKGQKLCNSDFCGTTLIAANTASQLHTNICAL